MKLKVTWGLAAASAALMLAACDAPADGSGASVVEEGETVADEAPAEEEAEAPEAPAEEADDEEAAGDDEALGTRDNPLDVGTRIEMGDWTLAVTEVTVDATELVMDENEFNDPPAEGRQFVMFSVDATYEGDDSGTAWLDFSWAIVGSGGNTFGTEMDDYCGSIPDSLDNTGETYPDGSVSGNVCVSVESDQIEGATIRIEEAMSFEDTRAFYALD